MLPSWLQNALPSILAWWLAVTAVGWLIYPLVFRALSLLPDRGLGMTKLAGLLLLTFFSAWFAFLFQLDASSPAGPLTAPLTALLALLFFTLLCRRRLWREFRDFLVPNWRMVLNYEAVFLAAFLLFLWFRSHVPDATFDALGFAGAEKWVNLSYLTALWRNPAIPPPDPWLSGFTANYYYFSHLIWATLARLTGTTPPIAFNLALGVLFAALVVAAFSTGWALSERKTGALLGVFLVAFAGPLATWNQVFGETSLLAAWKESGSAALTEFNFWTPSDVLPYTRNEFPAFNYLLGDLHAHAMGMLLLLLAVCLLVQLQRAREIEGCGWRELAWAQRPTSALLLVVMAAMWMTNAWDLVVLGLFGTAWILVESSGEIEWPGAAAVQGVLLWILAGVLAVAALAGFYTYFVVMPLDTVHNDLLARLPSPLGAFGAVGWVPAPERSPFSPWLQFWGLFLAGFAFLWVPRIASGLFPRLYKALASPRRGFDSPMVALLAVLAVVAVEILHFLRSPTKAGLLLAILLIGCGGFFLVAKKRFRLTAPMQWTFLLGLTALVCVLVPEFFFLDDPIGPPYQRYNTVFKLYYPAWALAGLSLAAVLAESLAKPGRRRIPAVLACAWLLAAGAAYPILGTAGRIGEGARRLENLVSEGMDPDAARAACRTLDGLAFMSLPEYAPDDLRLGLWMRDNLPAARRIAEAPGVSYTMAGRFAAISGIPSFLGWEQHEFQWRGNAFLPIKIERLMALDVLYGSENTTETLAVSRAYGLEWVAVGRLERERYPADSLAKFERIGKRIQGFGESALYRIPGPDGGPAGAGESDWPERSEGPYPPGPPDF